MWISKENKEYIEQVKQHLNNSVAISQAGQLWTTKDIIQLAFVRGMEQIIKDYRLNKD